MFLHQFASININSFTVVKVQKSKLSCLKMPLSNFTPLKSLSTYKNKCLAVSSCLQGESGIFLRMLLRLLKTSKFSASVLLLPCVNGFALLSWPSCNLEFLRILGCNARSTGQMGLICVDKTQTKHMESRILISASLFLYSQAKLTFQ